MRLLKSHSLLSFFNGLLIDLPAPSNISYLWNMGSLLGLILISQILTGLFLVTHYTPHISLAFESIEHIMRDINYGWLLRYLHANGASMFFLLMYIHIGRRLYYGSYTSPRILLWFIGVLIFLITVITAFAGYSLVWGQMSLWAATVISSLFSAIPIFGVDVMHWIWGGFSVDNPTLSKFFTLHFLFPFIILALVFLHLLTLHDFGSNNPTGLSSNVDKITFHPFYSLKDLLGVFIFLALLFTLVFFYPNILSHPDNYVPANPLVTPPSITPEWYFLHSYAILRSIPDKLGGVLSLFFSILVLFIVPFTHTSYIRSSAFRPIHKLFFWIFVFNFFILIWIGGSHPEAPYVIIGQLSTLFYFSYFLIITPLIGLLENRLLFNHR